MQDLWSNIFKERKLRPLCEDKVKERFFIVFFQNFQKTYEDIFSIFLFPLLDIGLGNIFSGICPRNTNWTDQNVQWQFQIARFRLTKIRL